MSDDRFTEAYRIALRMVERQDRFAAEVAQALASHGYVEETAAVLARLESKGILNDRRAAEAIIKGRTGRKAIGSELLRLKLAQRGASEELLDELLGEEDEAEKAYQALVAKHAPDVLIAKAGRFLASRGFSEEAIESALERFYES